MEKVDFYLTLYDPNISESRMPTLTKGFLERGRILGLHMKRVDIGNGPQNSKGLGVDFNTLVVSLGSAGVLSALIGLIRDWTLRAESRRVKIRVKVKDKEIEIDYSPTAGSEKKLKHLVEALSDILRVSK